MWFLIPTVFAASSDLGELARLPERAQALRDDGLDGFEVNALLDVLQASELPRKEVVDLLAHASILVKEHGPIDNFSGFVKSEITDGKRGAALHHSLTTAHQDKAKAATEAAAKVEPEPKPAPKPVARPTPRPRPTPKVRTGRAAHKGTRRGR